MPPKKSLQEQKKELKQKEERAKAKEKAEKDKERQERKALEQKDKIFGLKNKNISKNAQAFVKDVERNMKQIPGEQQKAEARARENAKKKAAEAQAQRELEEIMGIAIKQPKVPEGVDPKTIMCEFFKKGTCAKGWKCKFLHERKGRGKGSDKIDLFSDARDADEKAKDEDRMDDWDQSKLESVVLQKHGSENLNNKTTITCKHFLDAVEKRLYGWFWVCPGGGNDCKYRHALPPGYVLKSQLAALAAEEKEARRTDEEVLEEKRAKLGAGQQVTKRIFQEWKEDRDRRRAREKEEAKEARHKEGRMSGRELCEAGIVQAGHEDAGAMEAIKRDTSADDAAEAKAKEEAERNLARMRAMFAASGGVDRSEWFATGGDGDDDGTDDEDDAFFVDEDDMDEDELAAMLGQVTVGGDGGGGVAAPVDTGPAVVGSSSRARAAAAAAARQKPQQDDEALSGFLSNLEGGGGVKGGSGAKIVGTIKHREKDSNKKPKTSKKGGKGRDSDSEPEEQLDSELQALLAKRGDKSSQLKEVKLDTGLVTKSGAKSKTLLAAEAKAAADAAAAAAKKEEDPFAVDDDDDPFAVDDDDLDLDELTAAVKR